MMEADSVHSPPESSDPNKGVSKSKRRRNKKKRRQQEQQQEQQQATVTCDGKDAAEGHKQDGAKGGRSPKEASPQVAEIPAACHAQPSSGEQAAKTNVDAEFSPVKEIEVKENSRIPESGEAETGKHVDRMAPRKNSTPLKKDRPDEQQEKAAVGNDCAESKVRLDASTNASTNGELATPPQDGVAVAGKPEDKQGDSSECVKSKAQLRAERRAKQEAQRAAKAEKLAAGGKASGPPKGSAKGEAAGGAAAVAPKDSSKKREAKAETPRKEMVGGAKKESALITRVCPLCDGNEYLKGRRSTQPPRVMVDVRHDDPHFVRKKHKKLAKQKICPRVDIHKKVDLFSHLPQYEIGDGLLNEDWQAGSEVVNPSTYRCGMKMAYGKLMGAHNRCCALIEEVVRIIQCYEFVEGKEFARDFENKLSPSIEFLSQCRPMTAGMRAFIKYFKAHLVLIGRNEQLTNDEIKEQLLKVATDFYNEKLYVARKTISELAASKISDGDCILVYSCSSIVQLVLKDAWTTNGRRFRVIVADSDPLWEGRIMLRFLESEGIHCEYVSLSGVPSIMPDVTRVLLGAQALLNNGSVLSRAGTGLVASMANQCRRTVIVCCESYKFWERVQIDSFVYNELGDPSALVDNEDMRHLWNDPKSGLHYLNLIYDITPSELVTVVITDRGIMPAASAPVVLRAKNAVY